MAGLALAQAMVDRTAYQADMDDAIFTTHWEQPTSFDTAARTAGTTKLKTFWTAVQALVSNKATLREVRWYDVPETAPYKPIFVETIPVVSGGATGSAAPLPTQVAMSVTFKTANRKNWGRFYLPCLTSSVLSTNGYFDTSPVDIVATAADALTNRSLTPYMCIWSKTTGVAQDPMFVQVDDVPDVVRRRRANVTTYRKQLTAG